MKQVVGMLIVETIARIRREHFIEGKTIKEITRDLKVSRNTVRKVLRSGETSFEYERSIQPRPKLGRWAPELDELLAANAAKYTSLTSIAYAITGTQWSGPRFFGLNDRSRSSARSSEQTNGST